MPSRVSRDIIEIFEALLPGKLTEITRSQMKRELMTSLILAQELSYQYFTIQNITTT